MFATRSSPRGFTLIETLVAILLITVAIVAPMALTVQSLSSAEYARDEVTASNLAQEGIEAIRSIRDSNILNSAEGNGGNLFDGISYTDGSAFIVDGTYTNPSQSITQCDSNAPCPPLQTNGVLYSYSSAPGFTPSPFTRTMTVSVVRTDPNNGGSVEEIRVTSKVSWKTAAFQTRKIKISEDLYNWPQTNSAI